jgi:hypothetical protein
MKRVSALVAAILVILLAWANVGMAGHRNQLRQRVKALEQQVVVLEDYAMYVEAQAVFSIYEFGETGHGSGESLARLNHLASQAVRTPSVHPRRGRFYVCPFRHARRITNP